MLYAAMITVAAVLYLHLGMGDTLSRMFHSDIYLFRCCKCITFQSVLAYLLIVGYDIVVSITVAFVAAYISLWMDLGLTKLAMLYEKWSNEGVASEEAECDTGNADGNQGEPTPQEDV